MKTPFFAALLLIASCRFALAQEEPAKDFQPTKSIVYKQPEGEDKSVPTTGDALLLYNPVLDNGPGEYGHSRMKDFWKEISPAHNVAKHNPPAQPIPVPPTLYMLGTKDNWIPVETAMRFQKTIQEAGGKCEIKLHQDAPHGFFNREPYREATHKELVGFLISLGWIKE